MQNFKIVFDNVNNKNKLQFIIKTFNHLKKSDISIFNSSHISVFKKRSLKKLVHAYKQDYNIILNSLISQLIASQLLTFNGILNNKTYYRITKYINSNISLTTGYLHVFLADNNKPNDKIINNISVSANTQAQLDNILKNNIINLYQKHNIQYIYLNTTNKTEVLQFKNYIKELCKN